MASVEGRRRGEAGATSPGPVTAMVENHIRDTALGQAATVDVKQADVLWCVRGLMDKGLAPKTIMNVRGLLFGAFTTATYAGTITANPCRGVQLPKATNAPEQEMNAITREVWQLIRPHIRAPTARRTRCWPIWAFALGRPRSWPRPT